MSKASPRLREIWERVKLGAYVPCLVREKDGWHARWRTDDGRLDLSLDTFVRHAAMTPTTRFAEKQRFETLADSWINALRSETGLVKWDDAELTAFARELDDWNGAAKVDVAARAALTFILSAHKKEGVEISVPVPKGRAGLRALGQAACIFEPLKDLRLATKGAKKLVVKLTAAQVETFVRKSSRILCESGYGVKGLPEVAAISAAVELQDAAVPPKDKVKSVIPAAVEVRVAGERVTAMEVKFLLDQGSSYVFFRNRWIEVDRDLLRQALRVLERSQKFKLSPAAALGFAMGVGSVNGMPLEKGTARGWLRGLVNSLKKSGWGGLNCSAKIPDFVGKLVDYQKRGVAWMKFMTDHDFGVLLADDMGLGKTVQTIAWYLATRQKGEKPLLVVAPLSVVANWRREFAQFAPSVVVYTHLGEAREHGKKFVARVAQVDVVLTSYSLLLRDWLLWRDQDWSGVVLDEAQKVKNPDTRLARAVRSLSVKRRVMLTGTPVENSAMDIWSLEDFLNPEFLGKRPDFERQFVKPLSQNADCAAGKRLRHALEPFVLRRLKTEPAIARTLGPKREIKEYCELTDNQRREYEQAFENYNKGERSKGDIFALLTALKIVCDGESKIALMLDLVESILESGESVLVFTQYVKIAQRVVAALEERFGSRMPFLHGGLDVEQRQREIAAFNAPGARAFVLSLRAGGFGLNLTKATHVIHFDRWWNPAVENQATDRAHRIGQTRTVFVHTLITEGTLEERIDRLLEDKRQLAGTLVTGGESFLQSLDAQKVEELVKL